MLSLRNCVLFGGFEVAAMRKVHKCDAQSSIHFSRQWLPCFCHTVHCNETCHDVYRVTATQHAVMRCAARCRCTGLEEP